MTPIDRLEMTRKYKESIKLEELLLKVTNKETENLLQTMLLEFIACVKRLGFDEEPDYLLLKQILLNCMTLVPQPLEKPIAFGSTGSEKLKTADDCKLFDSVMFKTNDCSEGEHILTTGNCHTESDDLFIDDFQEKSQECQITKFAAFNWRK